MNWTVDFLPEAKKDIKSLDKSQWSLIQKALKKVSQNPLPAAEGGYGKPLSGSLAGCCKIKLRTAGLRAVYKLQRTETFMLVIVVGVRADEESWPKSASKNTVWTAEHKKAPAAWGARDRRFCLVGSISSCGGYRGRAGGA